MKKLQKGFSTIEILLVLILITLIGGVGYFVFSKQNEKSNDTATTTEITNEQSNKKDEVVSTDTQPDANTNDGYLVINEWGVKIKNTESSKIAYKVVNESMSDKKGDKYNSKVILSIKPEYLKQVKECNIGVEMYRYPTKPSLGNNIQVGASYYGIIGTPTNCTNNESDSDTILQKSILNQLDVQKLQAV